MITESLLLIDSWRLHTTETERRTMVSSVVTSNAAIPCHLWAYEYSQI